MVNEDVYMSTACDRECDMNKWKLTIESEILALSYCLSCGERDTTLYASETPLKFPTSQCFYIHYEPDEKGPVKACYLKKQVEKTD